MQAAGAPLLRDIHAPPPPPWWPPAPGWWWVAGVVACVLLAWLGWRAWRRYLRRRAERLFDRDVDAAGTPVAQVAAMSALLRRAARDRDVSTVALDGEAWLAWLDASLAGQPLSHGEGMLLREGAWRPDLDAATVAAARLRIRDRFVALRTGRR